MHVTLRARRHLPRFRGARLFRAVRGAIAAAQKVTFRVVHFSVQDDHLHLIVDAEDKLALSRGMRGLVVRVAKAINRVTDRSGAVWGDRYHTHVLRSPPEVRHALVYVLSNWRKHLHVPSPTAIDPCSSARWFDGWSRPPPAPPDDPPTAAPRTWLLTAGWRTLGLLSRSAAPRTQPPRRA